MAKLASNVIYKVPLITSYNKDIRCYGNECNNRTQYCCPVLGCKSGVCKSCFKEMDKNQQHYILNNNIPHPETYSNENSNDDDDDSTSTSESVNEMQFQRSLHKHRMNNVDSVLNDSNDEDENHSIDEQDEFNEMSTDIPF